MKRKRKLRPISRKKKRNDSIFCQNHAAIITGNGINESQDEKPRRNLDRLVLSDLDKSSRRNETFPVPETPLPTRC